MSCDASSPVSAVARDFAEAWARPDPDRFVALLHEGCRLLQPAAPPILGRAAAHREFTRLIRWLPDIKGEIDNVAADGATLLIAWRLSFSLGRSRIVLRLVDRLVVEDGLIREREAYYDSLAFMLIVLRRPTAWPGFLRYRGWLAQASTRK